MHAPRSDVCSLRQDIRPVIVFDINAFILVVKIFRAQQPHKKNIAPQLGFQVVSLGTKVRILFNL